jgi:carbon starvation protein
MLFILIACGAVSGFHSLVSSGTTAKQLARESDGKIVGFGSMITEGGLALLALLAVTAGLAFSGDAGAPSTSVPSLSDFLGKGGDGPISAFAAGFGVFTEPFMKSAGAVFGMVMLNAFVLTTLDTSVRLTRFISVELFGPLARPLKNRYVATILPVLAAYALAATGSQGTLWPMFGAANQLVAALAMIVVSAYFMKKGKRIIYTVVPAIFMLITTCGALLWKAHKHFTDQTPSYTLSLAALVLLALAVTVGIQGFRAIRKMRFQTPKPK